jgi:Skp family chaperone for outer membrane proteins
MILAAPAFAADEPASAASAFGVVDMNKVMQITDVAKDIFSQMEVKRKEYQTNISKEETSLRAAEQEILKQKDSLSKDEFDKKRKEFEEKVINGQKFVQERKRILDQAFSSSMGNLRGEAIKIVAEVAKERNYSAVFTQDAVMISTPSLDMTGVVIERMNKSVKKIPIDWSASTAAVAGAKSK